MVYKMSGEVKIHKTVGDILCGDIYKRTDNKNTLASQELNVTEPLIKEFELDDNLIMIIKSSENHIYLATKVYNYIREIRIEKGLFTKFKLEIDKPAKSPGRIRLSISDEIYSGLILDGPTNEVDFIDYKRRINILQNEIIPEILSLFGGKIVETRIGPNA